MKFRRAAVLALSALAAAAGTRAWGATGEWSRATGGRWWDVTAWAGSVPQAAGDEALFLGTIESPATITVDAPVSVGTLYVGNESSLTFAGMGPLMLASVAGDAFVGIEAGSHAIKAPVVVASHSVVHVVEGSGLTLSGALSTGAGVEFAKVSGGALRVMGPQVHGVGALFIAIDGETTFATDAGGALGLAANLSMNVENTAVVRLGASQHLAGLRVGGAFQGEEVRPVVVLEADGGRVIRTPSLNVDPTGVLDLTDNGLVVQATGESRGDVLAQVEGLVAAARNGAEGLWTGRGITSSAAQARGVTGLGVFVNDDGEVRAIVERYQGVAVDVNSVIVDYTYNGDTNFDGVVNADDYFRIDSGFLSQPVDPGYGEGDFNYDDRIDADDYFLIDSAFLGQSRVVGGAGADDGVSAVGVPEPGVGVVVIGGVLVGLRRRGRVG